MSHQDHRAVNLFPFTPHTRTMANTWRPQPFRQGDYLTDRRRPNRDTYDIPVARQVARPRRTSFPPVHEASVTGAALGRLAVALGRRGPLRRGRAR